MTKMGRVSSDNAEDNAHYYLKVMALAGPADWILCLDCQMWVLEDLVILIFV